MVKLEGEWYQVDCTFDDPVPDYGDVSYDNFNVTDVMMSRNHVYEIITPANGRKYSYYNYFYKGKVAHSLDEYYDELCKAIGVNHRQMEIELYEDTSCTEVAIGKEDYEKSFPNI